MKFANFPTLLLLAVVLSVAATGCRKTPKSPTPIFDRARQAPGGNKSPSDLENVPTVPPRDTTTSNLTQGPEGTTALGQRPSLDDYDQDHDFFKQDTVYFEFDKSNVRPNEMSKIQAVANYLKNNGSHAVLIEGNCDERGTPEYNRALGERRALSVRETLINLGIIGERVHTVSYGEDKPADPGHNEAAWAKNRRADFVLLKPKAGARTGR
jgi:peptidoglycan-associated lipoprotein